MTYGASISLKRYIVSFQTLPTFMSNRPSICHKTTLRFKENFVPFDINPPALHDKPRKFSAFFFTCYRNNTSSSHKIS